MKALLVVAHGSRRAESNDEVRQLTASLQRQAEGAFARVRCAFLELAEPSIPEGLRAAVQAGARDIVVVPYFLSAGRHVVSDIPAEVDRVRREHPDIRITLAPYVGASAGMLELLLQQARAG